MIEQNKDLWIHCEWFEEGGMAGVFIASWDKKENKLSVKDLEWEDWCMEEYAHHFRKQN